ncbi:hypothetical protein CEV34_3226 [Brucella pseudogrignonensis]|uniref:Uncharacterized protein n=1 Tax=Brucella pseudogrignonensis TaxID=419475 RepID=A0A256G9X9_9HYPH|nr:hypothetical protein CEV34_3226 [Brucella pseudogrignonensis]
MRADLHRPARISPPKPASLRGNLTSGQRNFNSPLSVLSPLARINGAETEFAFKITATVFTRFPVKG